MQNPPLDPNATVPVIFTVPERDFAAACLNYSNIGFAFGQGQTTTEILNFFAGIYNKIVSAAIVTPEAPAVDSAPRSNITPFPVPAPVEPPTEVSPAPIAE